MAQTNYTPISLYYSTTVSAAPTAGNLVNGELAINITDGKLYYKDNTGTVKVIAGTGGTGIVAGSNTQIQFNNSGVFGASANLTWDGTYLTANSIKNSALTSGRVTYAGASGLLQDSANLTFDGTTLTANALTVSNAVTLSGGTANGVLYLNGSKVATSGSALTFDGTTLANSSGGTPFSLNRTGAGTALIELKQSGTVGGYLGTSGSNDFIIFNGSAAELARFNNTGLGIGTSSPSTKLTVRGVTFTDNGATGGASGPVYAISASSGVNYGQIGNTGTRWSLGYGSSLTALGTEVLVWNDSGSVGIGTTSPNVRLEVATSGGTAGQVNTHIALSRGTTNYAYLATERAAASNDVSALIFGVNSAERARIDSSGNFQLSSSNASLYFTDTSGSNSTIKSRYNLTISADANAEQPSTYSNIILATDGSERARIDSSGNLGIGTTSPNFKTHISTGSSASITQPTAGSYGLYIQQNTSGSVGGLYIQDGASNSGNSIFVADNNGAVRFVVNQDGYVGIGASPATGRVLTVANTGADASIRINAPTGYYSYLELTENGSLTANEYWQLGKIPSTHALQFWNGSERARITSTGSLLVGTTTQPTGFNNRIITSVISASPANPSILTYTNGSGTSYHGIGTSNNQLDIVALGTNNSIVFLNGADGTTPTERARITSGGDFVVGKTATSVATQGFGVYSTGEFESNAGSNPAGYLNRTNDGTILSIRRSNTTVGTISVTTTATAYNTSSDYRLKENIQPMTGALAKVQALKPCTYNWKADGSEGEGFIAHELAEVAPQAVTGEKDAVDAEGNPVYQGIDTSFLVATLTAAIKEQQAIIEQLTSRIAALETK